MYESQVVEHLRRFVIPPDYQQRILELYRDLQQDDDPDGRRKELEGRLERIRKLYEWGDKPEEEYLDERRDITEELARIPPSPREPDVLAQLTRFLTDISAAWEVATEAQRNRLARQLFEVVWTKNERVVAVRPRPELRTLFQISEECQAGSLSVDPDRTRGGHYQDYIWSREGP